VIRGLLGLANGFLMTLRHVFRRPITVQYPEERREPAERFRGLHALRRYPGTGEERCISCCLCARICPTQCIRLVTSGEEKKVIDEYDVDLGHCLFCGLCAEVCPEEAIVLSRRYEASWRRREETILRKSDLLGNGEGL
jgi:NADH-quinone oxidoreductase chain I